MFTKFRLQLDEARLGFDFFFNCYGLFFDCSLDSLFLSYLFSGSGFFGGFANLFPRLFKAGCGCYLANLRVASSSSTRPRTRLISLRT